ncbi:hypothetical protein GQ55_4G072500 [Panicum hallii var. hallii]|uniref:Uncharacterized protein n=1 Tax=Panicum hallii var. hallii TaxID=1504633 RepID=A0A2T7DW87_9POAL|nr:hypothetical protein GQ55_4G072500 [Panicum hallii var. hallii]
MPGFPAGAVLWLPAGECSFLTEAAARLPTVKHGLLSGAAACFPALGFFSADPLLMTVAKPQQRHQTGQKILIIHFSDGQTVHLFFKSSTSAIHISNTQIT